MKNKQNAMPLLLISVLVIAYVAILSWCFNRDRCVAEIGKSYILKWNEDKLKDPFIDTIRNSTIIDIKKGYVCYTIEEYTNSCTIKYFQRTYVLVSKEGT